jgi:hypothetical protein
VGVKRVPGRPGRPKGTEREVGPAEASFHGLRIEIAVQPSKALVQDAMDESRRRNLADHQPSLRSGAGFDGVEQHGLPGSTRTGVARRSAGGAWAVLERLEELFDEVAPGPRATVG